MTRNGIRHPDVVDLVTVDTNSNPTLILVETDPLVADDAPALQEKLNNDLSFALDGQLAASYPQTAGRSAGIRLDLYAQPDAFIREFLARFATACAPEGVSLVVNIDPATL